MGATIARRGSIGQIKDHEATVAWSTRARSRQSVETRMVVVAINRPKLPDPHHNAPREPGRPRTIERVLVQSAPSPRRARLRQGRRPARDVRPRLVVEAER